MHDISLEVAGPFKESDADSSINLMASAAAPKVQKGTHV
jgi:hypothetical protein